MTCPTARTVRVAVLTVLVLTVAVPTGLTLGCASATKFANDKLPALTEMVNAKNAGRALVIGQAIRVGARDLLASSVQADGEITAAELERVARFDRQDKRFTEAWSKVDVLVTRWNAAGGGSEAMPGEFPAAYLALEAAASEWATEGAQ